MKTNSHVLKTTRSKKTYEIDKIYIGNYPASEKFCKSATKASGGEKQTVDTSRLEGLRQR